MCGCYLVSSCSLLPYMFYIAYYFKQIMHPVFMEFIALIDFQYVSKIYFEFPYYYIYSPTCETVMSDLFFWYSALDLFIFEEEPKAAAGEPQRLVEWQADNVI